MDPRNSFSVVMSVVVVSLGKNSWYRIGKASLDTTSLFRNYVFGYSLDANSFFSDVLCGRGKT